MAWKLFDKWWRAGAEEGEVGGNDLLLWSYRVTGSEISPFQNWSSQSPQAKWHFHVERSAAISGRSEVTNDEPLVLKLSGRYSGTGWCPSLCFLSAMWHRVRGMVLISNWGVLYLLTALEHSCPLCCDSSALHTQSLLWSLQMLQQNLCLSAALYVLIAGDD